MSSLWICVIHLPISLMVASLAPGQSKDCPRTSEIILNYHYNDVIMSAMASRITGISIVCRLFKRRSKKISKLRVTDDRWIPPTKGPVMWKMFSFDDVIMTSAKIRRYLITTKPDETLAVNKFLRMYYVCVFGALQPFNVYLYQTLCGLCADKNRFGDLGPTTLAIGQFLTKLGKRGDAYINVVHILKLSVKVIPFQNNAKLAEMCLKDITAPKVLPNILRDMDLTLLFRV